MYLSFIYPLKNHFRYIFFFLANVSIVSSDTNAKSTASITDVSLIEKKKSDFQEVILKKLKVFKFFKREKKLRITISNITCFLWNA